MYYSRPRCEEGLFAEVVYNCRYFHCLSYSSANRFAPGTLLARRADVLCDIPNRLFLVICRKGAEVAKFAAIQQVCILQRVGGGRGAYETRYMQ